MSRERMFGWWVFAENAARRLTAPIDVTGSDVQLERVLTGSSLYAAGSSMAATVERAAIDSRAVRGLQSIAGDIAPLSTVDRLRVGAIVALCGSMTALVLQALEPMRTTWLDSMLPVAVAVGAALVFTGARPLARALAAKRQ
jgi:pyrroline-5-carboxylate reductase